LVAPSVFDIKASTNSVGQGNPSSESIYLHPLFSYLFYSHFYLSILFPFSFLWSIFFFLSAFRSIRVKRRRQWKTSPSSAGNFWKPSEQIFSSAPVNRTDTHAETDFSVSFSGCYQTLFSILLPLLWKATFCVSSPFSFLLSLHNQVTPLLSLKFSLQVSHHPFIHSSIHSLASLVSPASESLLSLFPSRALKIQLDASSCAHLTCN
jgi:hypothetical protein